MILETLVDYYETLVKSGIISRSGYCKARVSHALNLSREGKLIGVIPLTKEVSRGKQTIETPQSLEVPKQVIRTVGIKSNFLCDNAGYVLGISNKDRPERIHQCFEAFKKLHHDILNEVDSTPARAILCFLDEWEPCSAGECTALADDLQAITSGANIIFYISGMGFAQEDVEICRAWEKYISEAEKSSVMRCLVTGREEPIARLHPSIKGVKGGQPTGTAIVSFNDRAYESYGREKQQGLNAPVSEYAAFAYTTVLNYLLSDRDHRQTYGDTTVVYWAEKPESIYRDLFAYILDPVPKEKSEKEAGEEVIADRKTEKLMSDTFKRLMEGRPVAEGADEGIDLNTKFYILGLSPNAARLSIRFFLQDSFGRILENQRNHYLALDIERSPGDFRYLPLWKLMLETVSPNSRDKASSPLLTGAVLRAILSDGPYPEALFNSVMLRVKAEHNVNHGKAAIIKAYLIKNKQKKYKEVLTVSLNEQSNRTAYILGRLFAVLEKAQQDANPGINATIKDRYFTSACATPANVFPILLRLAGHHTAKAKYGYISERRIQDLLDKLDVENNPYPAHLNLPDQGVFVLGYYQQTKANYIKTDKEEVKDGD